MTAPSASPAQFSAVHVVVTCTNRKTAPVPTPLRLGSVPGRTTAECTREWIARVSGAADASPLRAEDLYAGEHWMVARHLPAIPAGRSITLWVCSAGYGLISAAAQIRPYSASFSGQRDRVPGGADGARRWWHALAGWEGPEPGQARSIRDLVAADRSASFLLALSAAYLDACQDDITTAVKELPDPDRFLVVSAGARNTSPVAELMVPADAKLQAVLGGTRQALNARIAARLLGAGIASRAEATRHMAELLAGQPPLPRYERKKLSDEEVTAMITGRLAQAPGMPASRMLREFRDAGYACEQQRFAALHRQVAGGGQ